MRSTLFSLWYGLFIDRLSFPIFSACMKILWLDLNSSYAHSSLALPALHAQVANNPSVTWEIVSATINENPGMTAGEVYRHHPDIVAATCW